MKQYESRYECIDCSSDVHPVSYRSSCPDCGGSLRPTRIRKNPT
ncbi:rubrerythrin-like domain-containing protein [Salinadaptatus halalkaliphilus]|uniref:Rubrerythrin-like domain-containing protein n=1 Tax=Salinadaptatus halalkaliphilus TaxID=2419781 RepID=A0A4S3TMA8_9EURY|nr:rubrerythrin-like domain-containing protein [Salinadaptatus halalkaliphilus]THE64145.1 rubrerythrin-like domain-containing protein [Salinadaptatus halalkaliphilus]